jgi:Flp pilus assembly protein TadG
VTRLARRHRSRARHRGQALVEFALILPSILLILVGTLNFGFAFYSNMTLEYASREGARVGSALASGSAALPCAKVDDHVIAAVQRVLQSAGIPLRTSGIQWIRIYKATAYPDGSGYAVANNYNQWTYSAGGGPTVDGAVLDFVGPATPSWSACSRVNGATPDSLGVAISYQHSWTIPTGVLFTGSIGLIDKTVMVLNPTYP